MDTSTRFFAKLRSLALLLDTERANLEHSAAPNQDQDDDETESGAVQALHKLHSEVRVLKKQVQSQAASQEGGSTELRSFIKSCLVLKQRTTEDIESIQRHFEKYGYKPQKCLLKPDVNCKDETDVRSANDEPKEEPPEQMPEDEEQLDKAPACETPEKMPLAAVDPMRTPQLSDFGLSAFHLQMVLSNPDTSQGVPPVPAVALTPASLPMTTCESQPKTPKCSLRMDEEALTPRLEDFGITESTMCFNNDFTMDLFRNKPPKNRHASSTTQQFEQKAPDNLPAACVSLERLYGDSMESPEVPVFSTLEIKMNKQLRESCSVTSTASDPESRPSATTPELPLFETPYISKLISAKKETKNNKEGRPNSLQTTSPTEDPSVRVPSPDKPQMPACLSQTEERTPEMPKLQSFFSSTLPCIRAGNQAVVTESLGPVLQADEHTQDWCLATPRVRMEFDVEPRTPEMPDMSSVTQDIIKLVAQANNNKQATSTSVHTSAKASLNPMASGKENRAQSVAQVSEKEYHGLASYMKKIPLTSLNTGLDKINQVLEERRTGGETNNEEFHVEVLRSILDVGPQTPMYILCLVELKRLENVQGVGRNARFKVLTKA